MAKALGVSKSTVSRALSGKGRIGKQTQEKIREYAKAAGVWPPAPAQEHRSRCLGVVVPSDAYTMGSPFFQECMLGISETATILQYNVMITAGQLNNISGIRSLVENKTVDGIILMRTVEEDRILNYLVESGFPTGLTGRCASETVIQVDIDNKKAAADLTEMLIGRGFRKFAMVCGDISFKVNEDRCQGFLRALEKYDLAGSNRQAMYTDFVNMELVDNIINDIIMKKAECVICGDDVICTRLMSRLQAEGYRIPQDISIVSLYNSTNLNCFSPAVTAVNISAKQLGNVVGKQMINYLEGMEYSPLTMMDYEILFRKSAGKMYRG